MYLAIDTETTGPNLHLGCQPFMVQICDQEGEIRWWEGTVSPLNRMVHWDPNTVSEIYDYLQQYDAYVFHNAGFDIRALGWIHPDLPELIWANDIHDTVVMSHVLASNELKGLKLLSLLHLDILDDDEEELHKTVVAARRLAKKEGWSIADPDIPSLARMRGGYPHCDYWLPAALSAHPKCPDPVRWADVCRIYGCRDAERTMRLFYYFCKGLIAEDLWDQYNRQIPLIRVIQDMEDHGLNLLPRSLSREMRRYGKMTIDHERKAQEIALHAITDYCRDTKLSSFNIRSIPQMSTLLYDVWNLPVMETTRKGNPSTSADSLKGLLEWIDAQSDVSEYEQERIFLLSILGYRKANTAEKYLHNYAATAMEYLHVDSDGRERTEYRLHPSINQSGTDTTRISCTNPNLQNISKGTEDDEGNKDYQLRYVFGPPPGYVWYPIDYSQLQLRIFAYASGEESLIRAFSDGWDFHNFVASRLFQTAEPTVLQRRVAKNVNFALIFGAGRSKVDATAGYPGAYDLFRSQFPNVDPYMQTVLQYVRDRGYVETMGGYRLWVDPDRPYVGVNYIVQGTEGEIVKDAMIATDEYLRSREFPGRLVIQVHDELVFEFPRNKPHQFHVLALAALMEVSAKSFGVIAPTDISICKRRWSETKPWKPHPTRLEA